MRIAIGCDHGGYGLKCELVSRLKGEHEIEDFG